MEAINETPENRLVESQLVLSTDTQDVPKHSNPESLKTDAELDDRVKERESHQWLITRNFLSADNGYEDSDQPHVDVIHVAAVCPEEDMHDLGTFVASMRTERRELVFRFEVASLLVGDLTQESIEQQAIRLLRGLTVLREQDVPNKKRAIIFVAYDLGALVVKMALSLAARSEKIYPGIFTNTARLVFSGCPQRSSDSQAMELKLFSFLYAKKDDTWSHLLNAASVSNLARSVLQTTEMFINSKITLRSRIISLYADEKTLGRIHPAFDWFTATLGVPPEILIQEQSGINSTTRFPTLSKHVSYKPEQWIPHAEWIPIEKALLSRSSPHRQSQTKVPPPSTSHPILESPMHIAWAEFIGSQILYIHGSSYGATHDVADQVFLAWQAKYRDQGTYCAKALSFAFESTDPLRNSIPDMVASVLIQALAGQRTGSLDDRYHLLQDRFLFHGGWTEKSCINTLDSIRHFTSGPFTLFLLHDLDECSQDSRAIFLDYCTSLSERSEYPVKFLVTSRKPRALLEELREWPEINVDDFALHADNDTGDKADRLTRFCPMEDEKSRIRDTLNKLAPMDKTSLQVSLKLLQEHTGWPKDPSLESLTQFTHLLDSIIPRDTPENVLDKILRSNPDIDELCWVLNWLLCGYRPLSRWELTTILFHHHRRKNHETGAHPLDLSLPTIAKGIWRQLESWLRVLAEFSHDQVTIWSEIRDLLKEDTKTDRYIWNEVRRTAHQTIAEFCFANVATAGTQSLLDSVFRQYESQVDQQQQSKQVAAPILADGKEIAFYVVQSLPYHLSKCSINDSTNALWSILRDPTAQSFTLWAKVYWAMSNPFSRTPRAPESPLPILAGLGMLSYENMKKATENLRVQCLIAAAGCKRGEIVTRFLQEESCSIPVLRDALVAAIQAGDENTALDITMKMLSVSGYHNSSLWPQSTIWAATWLNMDKLVNTLLSNGASTEPQASLPGPTTVTIGHYPSPLYMASKLGHASVVGVLLAHGARTDVLRVNKFGALHTAAYQGHAKVIQEYVNKDPSHLKLRQPNNLLYIAAAMGSWRAVTALLELKMDPNHSWGSPSDSTVEWTPLARACAEGFPKTTKALLEYSADPNSLGPGHVDTPLWLAIMWGPHQQCIRHLLHHGGDPNHKRLRPHLLLELANWSADVDTIVSVCNILIAGDLPIQLNTSDSNGETALMIATRKGYLPLVQWLLKHGADVNALDDRRRSALYFALKSGKSTLVQELLKWKPKLDVLVEWDGATLLQTALHEPAIVKLLLDADADPELPSSSGDTLINSAVLKPNPDVVKMLIEKKVNIHHLDSSRRTPICTAVSHVRDASIVRLLADGGANLGETDDGGRSLLHLALDGPPEILKILLEFGKSIDPNRRDSKNQTPLLAATNQANIECLKLLIRAGADINAQDSDGETALHNTAWYDNGAFLSVLLSQPDIDVNRMSPISGSPLHVACLNVRVDSVPALLDHHANIDVVIPSIIRSTPLMAALLPGNQASRSQDAVNVDQIVRTLARHGADVTLAVPVGTFPNAISTACFGAGVSTINFLLDEGASSQQADPISGRVPLHFAAANGIENFQAILLSYRGDMMVADNEGKNCLHWAAQFGNAKTAELILSRMDNQPVMRARYVALADSDGWTPLCWAVRPCEGDLASGMRSEKRDHAGVVRSLLRHGANPAVTCQHGTGDAAETLTPLMLARQCDAGEEIINMLKYGVEGRPRSGEVQSTKGDAGPVRRYNQWFSTTCNVCLGPIFGRAYKCTSCPDIDVCKKCIATIATFHSAKTINDGQPHTLEINRDLEEYKDLPLPHPGGSTPGEGQEGGSDTGIEVNYNADDPDTEEMEVDDYI